MKRIKAAAIQIAPDLAGGTGTVDRVCEAIDRAAAQGVELAVFPETFIPYYPYFPFVAPAVAMGRDHLRLHELAVKVPGPVTERLARAAARRGMALVVGVNERDGCHTAIISPEGVPLCAPITEGEGMVIAELDPVLNYLLFLLP